MFAGYFCHTRGPHAAHGAAAVSPSAVCTLPRLRKYYKRFEPIGAGVIAGAARRISIGAERKTDSRFLSELRGDERPRGSRLPARPAMKLYEFAPTRSIRARWTLQELGVEFEAITVNLLLGENRKPEFLSINPAANSCAG